MLSPPVEGALAAKESPLRDVPGLRRRTERDKNEKNWKDEVRERVRHRKQEKARDRKDQELPLFDDQAQEPEHPLEPEPQPVIEPLPSPVPEVSLGEPPPEEPHRADPYALTQELGGEPQQDVDDLPLNPAPPQPVEMSRERHEVEARRAVSEEPQEEIREKWSLDEPERLEESPVERPALPAERARAAGVDLLFLSALWAVVVYFAYFAGRDLQAGTVQLLRTWPWLVGYLSFLGLTYAAYFTGTTGQTLGKILGGLRVVDTAGRPPGYLRSFARAAMGGVGVMLLGVGLAPMLVDPARRAFHDKLLGTRVVRK
jgi:uncharacterized RDD family membrane protein YckC